MDSVSGAQPLTECCWYTSYPLC